MSELLLPSLSSLDKLVEGSPQWMAFRHIPEMDLISFAYCLAGYGYLNEHPIEFHCDTTFMDKKVSILYKLLKKNVERHLDDNLNFTGATLCGVKGGFDYWGWTGIFPAHAYKAFCDKNGMKYPFGEIHKDAWEYLKAKGEFPDEDCMKHGFKGSQELKDLIPETVKELEPKSIPESDLKSVPSIVTWKEIVKLINKNEELGDVLAGAIEFDLLDEKDRTKENFKKILDPKAKAHKWGLSPNPKYSLSPNQVNVLYGAFFKSSDKRRGNPKIRQGKNVKKSK